MNKNQLNENFLYEADPESFGFTSMPYHCRNWVFRLRYNPNSGEYYMYDTYWSVDENPIKVTEDNIDSFKVLFDVNDVEKVPNDDEIFMYSSDDIFHVRDQNQFKSSVSVYKLKGAVKVIERQIDILKLRLKDKTWELNTIQNEIEDIQNELSQLERKNKSTSLTSNR